MFVGLNLGLTGWLTHHHLMHTKPCGCNIIRNQPLPPGYEEERFMSMMINGDLMFYMDYFEQFSFNASSDFIPKMTQFLQRIQQLVPGIYTITKPSQVYALESVLNTFCRII